MIFSNKKKVFWLMEDERRKSTRNIIIKQDPAFKYDDESIKFLVNTSESREVNFEPRHHRISSEAATPTATATSTAAVNSIFASSSEQVAPLPPLLRENTFKSLPLILNKVSDSVKILSGSSVVFPSASQSSDAECSTPNSVSSSVDFSAVVNKALYGEVQFRRSSTDYGFLDADNNIFLSVSPAAHLEISGMAFEDEVVGGGGKCECSGDNSCSDCAAGKAAGASVKEIEAPPQLSDILDLLVTMNKTVNTLTEDVKGLKENAVAQNSRIEQLEIRSRATSRASSRSSSRVASCDEARQSQGASDLQGGSKPKKSTVGRKKKQSREEEEKLRSLQVVQEQLKELKEKQGSDRDIQAEGESSDDSLFNVKSLKKKMSRKEKKDCDRKVADRLEQAGGVFPDEDSSSSNGPNSSGTDSESGRRRRSRRKVKSGAEVKKRPVIRTELWPHTVANEQDDEDLNSDTIGLQRFLSCFSLIMLNCGKVEKAGRANLLNAFSTVYECLPFTEARSFHNLVMLRLEQGEISWQEDFLSIAHKFLDRKVRLSLKSRGTVTGTSSFNKSGRRYGSNSASKGKNLYGSICRNWNRGVCTYGEKCKFKHVCWTCAEAGKSSEKHKASACSNSAGHKSQG